LRGLVGRIDALEAARSDLASKVEALQSDNVGLKQETGRLNRKVDGLTRDNAILREEIASLKHGESAATKPRKRSKTEHCVFMTLGNDTTVHIASFMGATDIASLGRTCGHFGRSCVRSDGQMTSLSEELAGQVVDCSATDYEKSVLARGRKIKMLHELEQMRLPLYFKQLVGNDNVISYPHQDMSTISVSYCDINNVTAISNHAMRTGKHYVTFCVSWTEGPYQLDFGVIRPVKDWDKEGLRSFDPLCYLRRHHEHREQLLAEKTEKWGNDLHCCSYNTFDGKCFHASWCDEDKDAGDNWGGDEWEGMEPLEPAGDMDNVKLGLLLDLNIGTLTVFKDGRMLGVMKEGLTGAYCWYVCGIMIKSEVKIERGMPPGEEEVRRSATS